MSEKSLPRTTPKWLRDLKQGRAQGDHPAPGGAKDETDGASGPSAESGLTAELCSRLARALPSLHRRAIGLSGSPAEAAELIQICCLEVLAMSPGDLPGEIRESGATKPFDDILHAAWKSASGAGRDKAATPRFEEVQKMAALTVDGTRRPRLGHIARTLSHLDPDQRRGLVRIAGLDAGADLPAMPKVILLALLMPFLERPDQTALERDDVADVLTHCVTALRQELSAQGGELEPAERDGVVLVFALVGGILPDLVAPGRDHPIAALRPAGEASAERSGPGPLPDPQEGPASAASADLLQGAVVRQSRDERLSRAYAITTSLRPPLRPRWPRTIPMVRNHAN